MNILEGEGLTLTRAVADAISLHPCQCDGHSADTCPSAIAALAAVRKWDAEHAQQPIGYGVALQCDFSGYLLAGTVRDDAEGAREYATRFRVGTAVVALVPVDGDGD